MNENYLVHYGIKRRSGRYPYGSGERPFQGTKRAAKRVVRALDVTKIQKRRRWSKEAPIVNFPEEFNHDRVLKKGTKVYRVSASDKEENKGYTFVTYKPEDNKTYSSTNFALNLTEGILDNGVINQHEYSLKKDLKIPSMQNMVDEYLNMFLTKYSDKKINESINRTTSLKYKVVREETSSSIITRWKNQTPEEAYERFCKEIEESPDSFFRTWMEEDVLSGSVRSVGDLGKEYINRLKKKGYDAIPDLNDTRIAEDPLFIFDREETMDYVKTNKTKIDMGWD